TGGKLMPRLTGTLFGEPCAPVAVNVIVPLRFPANNPPTFTETEMEADPLPEVGLTESHDGEEVAVHASMPPPELLTCTICDAGFVPPWIAENDRAVALSESIGEGGGGAGAEPPDNATYTSFTHPVLITPPTSRD